MAHWVVTGSRAGVMVWLVLLAPGLFLLTREASATINNTVTVYGTAPGGVAGGVTATADETVDVVDAIPSLVIDKQAQLDDSNSNGFADVGETITYHFDVTNNGNVTLQNITIGDTTNATNGPVIPSNEALLADAAPLNDSTDGGANEVWDRLAPGDTIRFSATYTVTQADVDTLQ